ncbi:MAG: tetratricopeptide repeat protein [Planctomycetes bacterium]|nr:tetratricopeptide repeat protein [Planctomycetota bacterium]
MDSDVISLLKDAERVADVARYTEAAKRFRQAMELAPRYHRHWFRAVSRLGQCLSLASHYGKAKPEEALEVDVLYNKAREKVAIERLDRVRRRFGEHSARMIVPLCQLGSARVNLGWFEYRDHKEIRGQMTIDEGRELARKAIEVARKTCVPQSLELAAALRRASSALFSGNGSDKQGREHNRVVSEVLDIYQARLGPDHATTKKWRPLVACMAFDKDNPGESFKLTEASLRETEENGDKQRLAMEQQMAASRYAVAGDHQKAIDLLEASIRNAEDIDDDDPHARTHRAMLGSTHSFLADMLVKTGKLAEAENHFRRALEIREESEGTGTAGAVMPAITMLNLAKCVEQQGRVSEALSIHRQALHIFEKHSSPMNFWIGKTLTGIARLLSPAHAEARTLALRAAEILVQQENEMMKRLTDDVAALVDVLRLVGEPARADVLAKRLEYAHKHAKPDAF